MGGWDTYIRIRDLTKLHQVPIVIYSTSDDPEDRAKAKEMGAVDFVHKPAKKAELMEESEKIDKIGDKTRKERLIVTSQAFFLP